MTRGPEALLAPASGRVPITPHTRGGASLTPGYRLWPLPRPKARPRVCYCPTTGCTTRTTECPWRLRCDGLTPKASLCLPWALILLPFRQRWSIGQWRHGALHGGPSLSSAVRAISPWAFSGLRRLSEAATITEAIGFRETRRRSAASQPSGQVVGPDGAGAGSPG